MSEKDEEKNETRIVIERPLYLESNFDKEFSKSEKNVGYNPIEELKQTVRKNCLCSGNCVKKQVYNRLPIIRWVKKYKIRENLLPDLLTGLTIGIMHIPQGMAYSLLATLPPAYGLYTSFFPVIIYMFFGTSRHLSLGTFAFASLMIARTITKYQEKLGISGSSTNSLIGNNTNFTYGFNATLSTSTARAVTQDLEALKVAIATAMTFWVGLVQLVMCVLQLGFLTNYLAEPLVNGLTTGVAIQVVVSQLKSISGIKVQTYSGILNLIYSVIDFVKKLGDINIATVIISFVCITFLAVMKTHVNDRFKKKLPVPIPIELIVVIVGTAVSYGADFSTKFKVSTVGTIPAGFKEPKLPDLSLTSEVILDAAIVAFVIFATNISQANTFARKHKYKINSSQELLAYGSANLVTSFFSGFVNAASLARSSVQDNAGGKTQLVSFFSSILVLIVLLVLAPLFKDLPQACLGSIILVSLKGVLLQITQLAFYWKVNKLEFLLWIITFLSIVILDVDVGLGVGIGFYIISFFLRSSRPYITILGNLPGTELYKDVKVYKEAKEIKGLKIIRMEHSIHAINSNYFRKTIYELSNIKPEEYANKVKKYEKRMKTLEKKEKEKNEIELKNSPQSTDDHSTVTDTQVDSHTASNRSSAIASVSTQEISLNETDIHTATPDNNNNVAVLNIEVATEPTIVNKLDDLEEDDSSDEFEKTADVNPLDALPIHHIILDCSPINYSDSVGVKTLFQIIKEYKEIRIDLYLAECGDAFLGRIREIEHTFGTNQKSPITPNMIHLTVHDAVVHALLEHKKQKKNK